MGFMVLLLIRDVTSPLGDLFPGLGDGDSGHLVDQKVDETPHAKRHVSA